MVYFATVDGRTGRLWGMFLVDYSTLDFTNRVADRINHLILPVFVLGVAGWPVDVVADALADSGKSATCNVSAPRAPKDFPNGS